MMPHTDMLSEYLQLIPGPDGAPMDIISRRKFEENSTYHVELITCKTQDNKSVSLFCKSAKGLPKQHGDHRNGIAYEAKIYADILDKIPLTKTRFYGHRRFPDTDEEFLLLEFLGDDLKISRSHNPDVLASAATWIGSFHALHTGEAPGFLKRYSEEYYSYWLTRFQKLFALHRNDFPSVTDVIGFFKNNLALLISEPQTIIHGEYYPANILIKDGAIYPVDWESAAAGPGEIDLATLIEGWDQKLAEEAKQAYITAKAASGIFSPAVFEKRLLLSQLYLFMRWWPDNLNNLSANSKTHLGKYLSALKTKVHAEYSYTV